MDKVQLFTQKYIKQNVPLLRPGDTVRVHERVKEKDGERIQVFEGLVIARKHGSKGLNATFTVRKISAHNVGVEKTYPLHSPVIQKIEVLKHDKVRRAKLYYLRDLIGKKKKRGEAEMLGLVYEEEQIIENPGTKETETNQTSEEKQPEKSLEKKTPTSN
jgi:large subunit ribosomal protein L19